MIKDLDTLIGMVDKETGATNDKGWTRQIDKFYAPFIKKIYSSDAMFMVLASNRKSNLYRYWALNNVHTLDEAKKLIHKCPMCHKELAIACAGNQPTKMGWLTSCHDNDCIKGFQSICCRGFVVRKGYSYEK